MDRDATNAQLVHRALALATEPGRHATAIPGLTVIRRDEAAKVSHLPTSYIMLPVQGRKRTVVGRDEYSYGKFHCFVNGVDIPAESHITTASPDQPFLGLALDLDKTLMAKLAGQATARPAQASVGKSAVMEAPEKVMNAFLRLLELLDDPGEIDIMARMLVREIHHRLLLGPQGGWIRTVCSLNTHNPHVTEAAQWIRENFSSPFNVEEMARAAGMSSSAFYLNFKRLTLYSPLQYQKRLRLYEAQRLMLEENFDVTGAAYAVGYESATQFSREYKKMFGNPPLRDIRHKREGA